MLTNRNYNLEEETDFIHNYYERLVIQEIFQQSSRVQVGDRDFSADVACVALNRLPPRYIRHDVDMTFFMSPQEMQEIETKVTNAVAQALEYVESRERGEHTELPPLESISLAEFSEAENVAKKTSAKTAAIKPELTKSKVTKKKTKE
ncbi:MAG: hypothetical protein EOO68_16805 [Moraxellaceae bacterium]|nr:MAG: hypothetical protein EOO68_16805 [Moraxellaceae bacterium]